MIDLKELEIIEFHDVSVNRISLINESKDLILEIELFDENRNDFVNKTLFFGRLNHISPKNIYVNNYSELEISSFEYYLQDEQFFGKLNMLKGFGKPDLIIDFSCETVELK